MMQGYPEEPIHPFSTSGYHSNSDERRDEQVMISAISKCVAGLDIHKAIIVCTLLQEDSDGNPTKETKEYKTFRYDVYELAKWLKVSDVEIVVMESTGVYWKQTYEALEDNGIKVNVVNARYVKNVPGRKTDVMDSEWLAELGRCGLVKPSFIPPRDFRELRLLIRYRRKLKAVLSAERNRLHKHLEVSGIKLSCVVSRIDGVSSTRMIEAVLEGKEPKQIVDLAVGRLKKKKKELLKALDGYKLSDRIQSLMEGILSHMRWLEDRLEEIDLQVVAAMEPYKEEWKLLQTLPGIDQIGAAMLLAEIGVDMSQFKNQSHLSSWAGMCPGNNESAGKRKSGKTRKGNKHVRTILCEIANAAIKTNSQFKGFYKGLVIRKGHKRAIVAVGHKILKIAYTMLKNKVPYRDPEVDYEAMLAKKNAPRWIAVLKKYGYLHEEDIKTQMT
jgi:transposase